MRSHCAILFVLLCIAAFAAPREVAAQRNNRKESDLSGARTEVYKSVGDTKLNLYIYEPVDLKPGEKRPAIVFFFGGGWRSGSPGQFVQQCRYLASRGMVAMTADYRVASRHQVKAVDCVRDAKSAIRWIRAHAEELHVDPSRIAAAGGSAGGHLAAATGTVTKFDEPDEDTSVSSRPNAMLLFNPALVLAPVEGLALDQGRLSQMEERTGVDPRELSPYHHVAAGVPPTVIFHGEADTTVPIVSAEVFTKAMKEAGNQCTLHAYPGEGHGFFNYGRGGNKMFAATLEETDRFLTSLGYLAGDPKVSEFVNAKTDE